MKTAKFLVLGVAAVAALGLDAGELFNVPFVLGPTHFKNGDQIVIQDVLATSTNLTAGDKVVVARCRNAEPGNHKRLRRI
jgi:hypothetical protein